jgi:hypothetical protein
MDSPAGSEGSTSPSANSGFLTTGPLRQAGSAGSKPVRRVSRSPGLTPVDFGFPLSMRRSHVRALIRAHLEDKKPQQRITWVTSRPHPEGDPDNEPVLSGVPALLRYRTKTEEELMAAVPRRIPQLVQQYWGYSLMPFQRRILELLFTGGYVDILVPTLHGKSTLCDVVFPILSLMHNPNGAHIICCTNHQDAKRWLLLIKQKLESSAFDPRSSELLRDYPWLAKPKGGLKKWSTTEITIDGRTDIDNPNPSVFAIGRGSDDIKGRRAKFIGDDLEGKGAVRETARAELWDWMTLEAMRTIENRAIEPRRLFANIGTPWDPDSIHFRLADLTDGRTGEQVFTVFRQPYKHESGRLIWPLQGPRIDELRQAWKEDTRQWQIAMELNPKGDNPFALTLKEIQDHSQAAGQNPLKEAVAGFVTLDPASGSKNARADYAGIAVLEIRWPPSEILPFVKVSQAYRYTDEAIPQVIYAAELSRQTGYPVVVEMNAMQRVYKGLFQRLAPDVKVIPFYTTEANKFDKRMGLSVLKTLARSDRLAICDSEGGQTLMREIRDLGTGAHDHLAMAVWFPISFVYQWQRRQARRKQVVSTSPARGYQPLVGRRTLRIVTPFQARTGSPFAEPPDERLLVDTHPG